MDNLETVAGDHLASLTGRPNAQFRSGQLEAIQTIVEDRGRALVVQRTGWGKSAVYLISTRLLRDSGAGPTIIVSPLLALIRNQIQMTEPLGIEARSIDSSNTDEWEETLALIDSGGLDILLIAPERLANERFRRDVAPRLLASTGLLVIDEVHCISDWGHDFRPDYRRLQQTVAALPPNVPVLGTTATANDRVVADVEEQLGAGLRVSRGTLDRESLSLHVLPMPNKAVRMAWLSENIPNLPGSGIVYCLTVRDAERVAAWLRLAGIAAVAYTGDMDNSSRISVEEQLSSGKLKVVVATSALAMGYDNPLIEFVIHYQIPGSPIAYYQQVGRAGRAVDRSYGIALSGWEDEEIQDYFIKTAFPTEEQTNQILTLLRSEGGMTRNQILASVNLRASRIEATLKILEVEGAVYKQGSAWFRSANPWTYPSERVQAVTRNRRVEQAAMREYVTTEECLMQFLRRQLDDPEAEPCGRCSNCAGPQFSNEVGSDSVHRALTRLNRTHLSIDPRLRVPYGVDTDLNLKDGPVEVGRSLTRWGDPGLAELVRQGKYEKGRYGDDLVEAFLRMLYEWSPRPKPNWVTWVPSSTGRTELEDFAGRVATRLGVPAIMSLTRVRQSQPQKTMENSAQQFRNIDGAFEVTETRSGPVYLIDDMVDSGWTITIVGSQLRSAGAGPVYPVALTDTSNR